MALPQRRSESVTSTMPRHGIKKLMSNKNVQEVLLRVCLPIQLLSSVVYKFILCIDVCDLLQFNGKITVQFESTTTITVISSL